MNKLTEGLKKLVATFDANQRAIIKETAHSVVESYSNLPGMILSPVKTAIDKFIDRFIDDSN